MHSIVRVDLKMFDYCSACGFKCCNCPVNSANCSRSALCDSFPLLFDGFSPYGQLGVGGWGVSNKCNGLGIKVGGLSLSDILVSFAAKLNTDSAISSLSNGCVSLSVIKSCISDVPVYAKYLFRSLSLY